MASRRIHKESFSLSGAGTTTTNFNPIDLSHAQALLLELTVATGQTAAGDTLDVVIDDAQQDGIGGQVWNARARFTLVKGNDTFPETFRLNMEQAVAISQAEQSYQVVTSGASEIGSGTVRNGPFPAPARSYTVPRAGQPARLPTWRVRYIVAQTGAAAFTGVLTVHAYDLTRL